MSSGTVRLDRQAELRWHAYLDEIRQTLSSLPTMELEDIIEELESHLSSDVDANSTSLSERDVAAVIDRLGSPRQMAEAYGISATDGEALQSLDLSLLFGSLILLLTGAFIPVVQIALLPCAMVLARIALQKPEVMASPYRYLGYPALLIGFLTLVVVVLLWPLIPVLPIAATGGLLTQLLPEVTVALERESGDYWIGVWSLAVIVVGLWWLLLRHLLTTREAFLNRLFQPFTSAGGYPISATRRALLLGGLFLIVAAFSINFLLRLF